MSKKIISLFVDSDVYDEYMKQCREFGIIMSKQVENFMRDKLKK